MFSKIPLSYSLSDFESETPDFIATIDDLVLFSAELILFIKLVDAFKERVLKWYREQKKAKLARLKAEKKDDEESDESDASEEDDDADDVQPTSKS